jgi:hypothetical protein
MAGSLARQTEDLALPRETLRALPAEHLCTLSDEVQEQIRKRLQEAAHE